MTQVLRKHGPSACCPQIVIVPFYYFCLAMFQTQISSSSYQERIECSLNIPHPNMISFPRLEHSEHLFTFRREQGDDIMTTLTSSAHSGEIGRPENVLLRCSFTRPYVLSGRRREGRRRRRRGRRKISKSSSALFTLPPPTTLWQWLAGGQLDAKKGFSFSAAPLHSDANSNRTLFIAAGMTPTATQTT